MHRITRVLLLGALMTWQGAALGCQGATPSGRSYVLKVDREIEAYLAYEHETVFQAAADIVTAQFKYTVDRQAYDRMEGIILARAAKNDTVRVETYRESERMTRIEVFVGPFGDEPIEREILAAIEKRLAR